jgi:sugar phosphate isomerase/epimerase
MIKHAIASFDFNHLGILGLLRKAAQLGYDGVEGNYPDLFTNDRGLEHRYVSEAQMRDDRILEDIRKAMDEYGTTITGIHGPVVPLNAPNWGERLWMTREGFRRMSVLGIPHFTVHAGSGTVKDLKQELPVIEKALNELAEMATEYGITVCIESGANKVTEINTIPRLAELIGKNPKFAHTADLSHNFNGRESDDDPYSIDKVIGLLGDKVRLVHAVDHDPQLGFGHDLPAGMGRIDWKRFFKGILAKGFDGVVASECSPDKITAFMMKMHRLVQGHPYSVMPPCTTEAYADPNSRHLAEKDPNIVLGHHNWMRGIPFPGVVIHWEGREDAFDGMALGDQLNSASLRYLKQVIAEAEAELKRETADFSRGGLQ